MPGSYRLERGGQEVGEKSGRGLTHGVRGRAAAATECREARDRLRYLLRQVS